MTDPFQRAIQTLTETKQLHADKTEALKALQDTLKTLKREEVISQKLKMQLRSNTTISDDLQLKLQKLQQERANLHSNTSEISETLLNSYFQNKISASCQLQCAAFNRKQLRTVQAWVAST